MERYCTLLRRGDEMAIQDGIRSKNLVEANKKDLAVAARRLKEVDRLLDAYSKEKTKYEKNLNGLLAQNKAIINAVPDGKIEYWHKKLHESKKAFKQTSAEKKVLEKKIANLKFSIEWDKARRLEPSYIAEKKRVTKELSEKQLSIRDIALKELATMSGRRLSSHDVEQRMAVKWDDDLEEPFCEVTAHIKNRPGKYSFLFNDRAIMLLFKKL